MRTHFLKGIEIYKEKTMNKVKSVNEEKSVNNEINTDKKKDTVQKHKKITGFRIVTGVLGAALLVGGLWQGEYTVTLNKAVRICLECIGIG